MPASAPMVRSSQLRPLSFEKMRVGSATRGRQVHRAVRRGGDRTVQAAIGGGKTDNVATYFEGRATVKTGEARDADKFVKAKIDCGFVGRIELANQAKSIINPMGRSPI